MEIRQLRCLLTLAETLHFGRAAQRMDMLPASFGRQIRLLEESLGVRLLLRTTRHVALTDAGREMVDAARDILSRVDKIESRFRDERKFPSSTLRMGVIDSAALGLVPQLVPIFRNAHPDVDLELLEQKTIRLLPRLLSGRLDIAIIRPPESLDPRLECMPLLQETAVVAVPSGHRLAKMDRITVEDMVDEPLIIPDRRSRPHSHDLTMKLFLDAGHSARIAQIAEEKQTIVSLVGTGVGLAIVPRWTSRLAIEGVAFVPLIAPPNMVQDKLALAAVWIRNMRHPSRDAFLDVLNRNLPQLAKTA